MLRKGATVNGLERTRELARELIPGFVSLPIDGAFQSRASLGEVGDWKAARTGRQECLPYRCPASHAKHAKFAKLMEFRAILFLCVLCVLCVR